MKAIVTIGIPGSGKTTWAKEQKGFVRIERDQIRLEVYGTDFPSLTSRKRRQAETLVTAVQKERIEAYATLGKDVIISDTNINPKTRNYVTQLLESLGYEVEYKHFPISYEVALRRVNARYHSVPADVVWDMYKRYNEQFGIQPYCAPDNAPNAVIFDIDGTLAHMTSRSPFDWERVGEDLVDEQVRFILESYAQMGTQIILLSGRDSVCREETSKWLQDNHIPADALYMRPKGDTRADTEVKYELFNKYVSGKFNVLAVFDDRPSVCRLWNLLGLKLFKLGDQSEF